MAQRKWFILCLALLVTACGSVPLASLFALRNVDFSTTDLGYLRVAVTLPDAIRPKPQGVELVAVTQFNGSAEEKTIYHLTEAFESERRVGVKPEPAGFKTYFYRLSPSDLAAFEALRAKLIAAGKADKHGSLGFGIETAEFCTLTAIPPGPLLISTYLLTSET